MLIVLAVEKNDGQAGVTAFDRASTNGRPVQPILESGRHQSDAEVHTDRGKETYTRGKASHWWYATRRPNGKFMEPALRGLGPGFRHQNFLRRE
jgi:hypothetical protein